MINMTKKGDFAEDDDKNTLRRKGKDKNNCTEVRRKKILSRDYDKGEGKK